MAGRLGISVRNVQKRRRAVETRRRVLLPILDHRKAYNRPLVEANKAIIKLPVVDGTLIVGSDAHIWPGPLTTMQRAFLAFAKKLKPYAIIANGDFFDGAKISRWPSIGWEAKPEVYQELEAVKDY